MHQRYVSRRSHSYRSSSTPLPPGPGRCGQRSMQPSMRCKQPGACASLSAAHHPAAMTHYTQRGSAGQRIHARSVRSPCPRRARGPGLACPACAEAWRSTPRTLIAINVVHRAHHATTRMPVLARAHRAQTPSIGAHGARLQALTRRLCCATPSACSPGSIMHARTSHSTLYTHGHGEGRGTCMQNAQQGEHAGQGGARHWQLEAGEGLELLGVAGWGRACCCPAAAGCVAVLHRV